MTALEMVRTGDTGEEHAACAAPGVASGAVAHKLWGGRFAASAAPALEAVNRSIGVDIRLWPFDIELSKAWAVALWTAGVLSLEESRRMEAGLDRVAARMANGISLAPSDEDVHTLVDRLLTEEVGELAARLHTGRSRNDQVATGTRLWAMDACARLDEGLRRVQRAIVRQAESVGDALMPAYTHLQRAQPVLAAHWLLAHFWPLERDRARLAAAARSAAVLPLGSGAVAGTAYPVSRVLLKETLGFTGLSANSVDAVGDRDFVAELLFALALAGAHLSRLAEDVIIFGSSEFGFIRFGDGFTTGSSMMPQKRNPDAFEIARSAGARLLGDLVALLATLKGLPSGYSKDLQDDKRALFDAVDAALLVLPAMAGAVAELEFDTARMASALTSEMMATDLADHLVGRGVSFREAHSAVGRLVREAEERGVALAALPGASFTAAHRLLDADAGARLALDPAASVARREVAGGTGPAAVAAQLELARQALGASCTRAG